MKGKWLKGIDEQLKDVGHFDQVKYQIEAKKAAKKVQYIAQKVQFILSQSAVLHNLLLITNRSKILKPIHFVNSICRIFIFWKRDPSHQTFPS